MTITGLVNAFHAKKQRKEGAKKEAPPFQLIYLAPLLEKTFVYEIASI
jgi:hypothetical protein